MTLLWPVAGVLFALLWLFVRGVALSPLPILGEFLIGLAVGLPVAYASRRLYDEEVPVRRSLRVLPYGALYTVVFLKDLIIANFDVAYRVLAPWAPIKPSVIVLPLRVETDLGITTIANSITLTPGTLTMDYDAEHNALIVHTLYMPDRESVVRPIRTWENYALVIFNERGMPGDPIPEIPGDDDWWAENDADDEERESESEMTRGGNANGIGGESGGD